MATTLVPPKFVPQQPKPFLSELYEKFAKENPVYLCILATTALLISAIVFMIVQAIFGIHSH